MIHEPENKSVKVLPTLCKSLLVLLVSAPMVLLLLAIEATPVGQRMAELSSTDLARIERLLLESVPSAPDQHGPHDLQFTEAELNLLAQYAVHNLDQAANWGVEIEVDTDQLQADLSLKLSRPPLTLIPIPLYLNLRAEFLAQSNTLQLIRLRAGKIQVPGAVLHYLVHRAGENLAAGTPGSAELRALLANVEQISVDDQRIEMRLNWDPVLADRLGQRAQQLLISAEDKQRIHFYYQQITLVAAAIPADLGAVSLNTFLVPLFSSAMERTQAGSDPIAENRALLQALAVYVNGEAIGQLLGPEQTMEIPRAKAVEVRLHRRHDLAQHLVSIAALSTYAGPGVAELLSSTKEAYDARYRTGFSFSDLAANSAGVLLAGYLTHDPVTATMMQQRLAALDDEADYMPVFGNNRDGLSESDFAALYEDRSSPEYLARVREIRQLIAARPLFQNLP